MCEQNYYYIYVVDVNCLTIDCTDYMPLYIKCHCIGMHEPEQAPL